MIAAHKTNFETWLELTLEGQMSDLLLFMAPTKRRRKIVEAWLLAPPFEAITPNSASPEQIKLFCADLEALLELMIRQEGML